MPSVSALVTSVADRRPLGPLDLPWVLLETRRHPMHVGALVVCEPPGGSAEGFVEDLVERLHARTAVTDPFNRRLLWIRGYPHWQLSADVDIDDHLFRDTAAAPGGRPQLEALVAALHRTPLDMRRPLWQVHVIDGLAAGRFALYAKFHHSLVDGVGAIRVLRSAFSADAHDRARPAIWAYPGAPTRPQQRSRSWRRAAVTGARAAGLALQHLTPGPGAAPYTAPRSVLNGAISSERIVSTQSLELDRLRGLADAMHGSVNDAYLTVCSTALRSWLLATDALPARSLSAAVPVSVRGDAGGDLGNAITFAYVTLGSDSSDIGQRAAAIVASTADAKARLTPLSKAVIDTCTVALMAPFIITQMLGLGARVRPIFNVAISNMPGPRESLYFCGARVLEAFPVSLLQSGQALNITALSYAGQLNITITACDAGLPGIGALAGALPVALDEVERFFGRQAATR